MVQAVQAHLDNQQAPHQPTPSLPLSMPRIESVRPSPHDSQAGNAAYGNDPSPTQKVVDSVFKLVPQSRGLLPLAKDIHNGNVSGVALHGLEYVSGLSLLGAGIRIVAGGEKVITTAAQLGEKAPQLVKTLEGGAKGVEVSSKAATTMSLEKLAAQAQTEFLNANTAQQLAWKAGTEAEIEAAVVQATEAAYRAGNIAEQAWANAARTVPVATMRAFLAAQPTEWPALLAAAPESVRLVMNAVADARSAAHGAQEVARVAKWGFEEADAVRKFGLTLQEARAAKHLGLSLKELVAAQAAGKPVSQVLAEKTAEREVAAALQAEQEAARTAAKAERRAAADELKKQAAAKAIEETNARWAAPLSVEKIRERNPGVDVDGAAVKSALSLLDKLKSDIETFKAPSDVVPELLDKVSRTREALVNGRFENSMFTSYLDGIKNAQRYFLFRNGLPGFHEAIPGNVRDGLINILETAERALGEMKFVAPRVVKEAKAPRGRKP